MNKYYELAMAMEKTRGDWSEGFYRVSNALLNFKVETKEDKLIYEDIKNHLDKNCGDGRIFRDCKYNYDWIKTQMLTNEERKQYKKEYREYLGW